MARTLIQFVIIYKGLNEMDDIVSQQHCTHIFLQYKIGNYLLIMS